MSLTVAINCFGKNNNDMLCIEVYYLSFDIDTRVPVGESEIKKRSSTIYYSINDSILLTQIGKVIDTLHEYKESINEKRRNIRMLANIKRNSQEGIETVSIDLNKTTVKYKNKYYYFNNNLLTLLLKPISKR